MRRRTESVSITATTLAGLIPEGRKNAISKKYLIAVADDLGLVHSKDREREVRKLISEARFAGCPILYNTETGGYYRPTKEEIAELRAYIKAEEHRAKTVLASLNSAKDLLSDLERGVY